MRFVEFVNSLVRHDVPQANVIGSRRLGQQSPSDKRLRCISAEMNRYRFGDCVYSAAEGLLVGGNPEPLTKTQSLLLELFLTWRSGDLITKEDLLLRLWDAYQILIDSDQALHQQISRLRSKLGDDPQSERYIQTFPNRGYRFKVPVHVEPVDATQPPVAPSVGRRVRLQFVNETREITREKAIRRVEARIESLVEGLDSYAVEHTLEDQTQGLTIVPYRFTWECLSAPRETSVQRRVVLKTRERYRWVLTFSPPLRRGETVHYRYESIRRNEQPFTFEEAAQRIKNGTYKYNRAICEAIDLIAGIDVGRCTCEVLFPEHYKIVRPRSVVYRAKERTINREETARMSQPDAFKVWKALERWHVKLDIVRPVAGNVYYVLYTPPRARERK